MTPSQEIKICEITSEVTKNLPGEEPIDLKECIILDNGSTIDLLGNKKSVSNV